MTENLELKAEMLAAQPYSVEILSDETTDGEPIYVAYTPELPGCKSHGETVEEALANLADARKEYILDLLEDGEAIPFPMGYARKSTSYYGYSIQNIVIDLRELHEKVALPEPQKREDVFPTEATLDSLVLVVSD